MPALIIAPAAALPAGMNKNNTQTINAATSDVKVVDWVVRAGYENSAIVGNELVMDQDVAAVIRCRITLTDTWNPFSGSLQVSLMRNDAVLATESFVSGATAHTLADIPVELSSGDRIWVRMSNTTNTPYQRTATVQAGANTYLIAEV